jgi:hypothetical protein
MRGRRFFLQSVGCGHSTPELAKKNRATLVASQGASQDKASAPQINTKKQNNITDPAASHDTPPTSGPSSYKKKK